MVALSLKPKMRLIIGEEIYEISERTDSDVLRIVSVTTDTGRYISQIELGEGIASGTIRLLYEPLLDDQPHVKEAVAENLNADDRNLTGPTAAEYDRRRKYVAAFHALFQKGFAPSVIKPVIRMVGNEIRDARPPSYSTAYRWYRRYMKSHFDIRGVIPNYRKRGNYRGRLKAQIYQVINESIDAVLKPPGGAHTSDIVGEVNLRIKRHNAGLPPGEHLKNPHPRTIYRYVAKRPPGELLLRRKGERAYHLMFNAWGIGIKLSRPLERVEIDHSKLDIYLVDEELGLPLGRPWITMAIDVYTGMPLGFHIGLEDPGWQSLMLCLKHSIFPKRSHYQHFEGIEGHWDAYGIPDMVVVDNGRDFHSRDFELACQHLNIHIQHAQARCPWLKGSVERTFRDLNEYLLGNLPGYTFSNVVDKGEFDPKKNACLDLETLKAAIYRWIIDVFNKRVKQSIRDIPERRWARSILQYPRRMPASQMDVTIALFSTTRRTAHRYGIEHEGLTYNSDALAQIRHSEGEKVKLVVRYNPTDLGSIYVIHPKTGTPVLIPATDPDYASGMSLWMHRIIRNYWVSLKEKRAVDIAISVAKAELFEAARDAMLDKRLQRYRSQVHRFVTEQKKVLGPWDEPNQDLGSEEPAAVSPPRREKVNDATAEARRQEKEDEALEDALDPDGWEQQ